MKDTSAAERISKLLASALSYWRQTDEWVELELGEIQVHLSADDIVSLSVADRLFEITRDNTHVSAGGSAWQLQRDGRTIDSYRSAHLLLRELRSLLDSNYRPQRPIIGRRARPVS